MKVQYIGRVKTMGGKTHTFTSLDLNDLRAKITQKLNTIESTKVVEIEERKRNDYGQPIETTIKYFYEW